MQDLQRGNNTADVMFLQRLLNLRGAAPRLREDGDFGPRTEAAVTAFQRSHSVRPPDGVVRAATWTRFGAITERDRRSEITLFAQPNNMTCWSAAATMMGGNRQSVFPGGLRTAPAGTFPNGQTRDVGGLGAGIDNIEAFCAALGWRMVNQTSAPGPSVILQALARGPVWATVLGGGGHAIVITSGWSDGSPNGFVVRIADPWPVGRGSVYGSTYDGSSLTLLSGGSPWRVGIQYLAQP